MKILFPDESVLDALRVYKTRDFVNPEIRVTVELVPGTDIDALADMDFSDIVVKRLGMDDVRLEDPQESWRRWG